MALPFLTPSRTVLIIGDEALSVYNVTFNAARLTESVPWQADNFDERVVRLIRHDCGNKPVLLINDMTDQHFKGGQRMPRISILDKQSVLDRKLQVAFPNYPIRGALPIKQSKGVPESKEANPEGGATRSGGMFLFAAVPLSETVAKAIDVAKKSMASISGFVLLPVEASDMVAALSQKLSGKERERSRWTIFIGQHHGGALRQVIIRDGQLAMTRMTPVADSVQNPVRWAADVSQEFKATIGYLSRFGYAQEDGTDVIVIATSEAGDMLKSLIDIPCNYTSFTVNEAARLLGIGLGLQEDQAYADSLHAAWIGRKTKFVLPMRAQQLATVVRPRQYAAVAMFFMVLAAGYFGWQMISEVSAMVDVSGRISDQKRSLTQAKADEDKEDARMKALGFDVKLIKSSMNSYDNFEKANLRPLWVIQKIGQAMGGELRLGTLKIEMVDASSASGVPGNMGYHPATPTDSPQPAEAVKKDMLATLTLSFPPNIEPATGVKAVNDFQSRLQKSFPGYDIAVTKQVADLAYTSSTSGKIGVVGDSGKPSQDYVAELQIRGPLHD